MTYVGSKLAGFFISETLLAGGLHSSVMGSLTDFLSSQMTGLVVVKSLVWILR